MKGLFKQPVKMCAIGKTQHIGDLRHGQICLCKEAAGLFHTDSHSVVKQVQTGILFNNFIEISAMIIHGVFQF